MMTAQSFGDNPKWSHWPELFRVWRDGYLEVVRSASLGVHRLVPPIAHVNALPSKRGVHLEEQGTLATTNINPLPAKQASIDRPSAWSEHCQAYSDSCEQQVHDRRVPGEKTIQSSSNACKAPAIGVHKPASSKMRRRSRRIELHRAPNVAHL